MTQYTHTITKEEISLLEIEEFPGRILVIDTEKDADKAVSYLTQFEAVGFDTETRPSFKKGTRYKISLMQISTDEACFLFRLNRIGIPQSLEFSPSRAAIRVRTASYISSVTVSSGSSSSSSTSASGNSVAFR